MENNSPVSTILFVIVSTNLFLLFSNPSPVKPMPSTSAFNPAEFLLSRLSSILMLYISSLPFLQHQPLSLHSLLHKIHSTWHRPALTLLCIELYHTTSASLILMMRSLASNTLFPKAVVIFGCISLVFWLWPVAFAHSEIACKMALVMSVTDGEQGMEAVKQAGEMVEGRKVKGFILTVVAAIVEGAVPEGVVGFVVRLLVWFVYTEFYYECRWGSQTWKRK